jgi:hypothetical protein
MDIVAGGLRQLVMRLTEGELLLVKRWVEQELELARKPALRLIRTPSSVEPGEFAGTFVELASHVRKRITELPEDRLLVLSSWVGGRLRGYGYED